MRTLIIFFVLALTFYGHWAAAQHPHGGATTQPVELHPGLGNYQHPITRPRTPTRKLISIRG